jgi:predicted XRE-type DNA-binding protein
VIDTHTVDHSHNLASLRCAIQMVLPCLKDLAVPNADEHMVKVQFVFKIDSIMKQRKLKQVEAAALFGVRQPDVSTMLRGEFRQFSVERLLRFLVALNQDVEIVVNARS